MYTTTFRRLIDPTANRLENFWWHVWGSDRKHLSGETLARIFEEISTGPTIVPLRGPANRWEPPPVSPPPLSSPSICLAGRSTNLDVQFLDSLAPPWKPADNPDESTASTKSTKSTDSSKSTDSKPDAALTRPPPHPILKKSRGDSKSGPRPTARFAFPDDEEDEASSGSGVEMQRSTSGTREKKAPKKFHASVGAKRRPALPRRVSSQSSASEAKEDGGARVAGKRAARPGVERKISNEAARRAIGDMGAVTQTRSLDDVRAEGSAQENGSNGPSAGRLERAPNSDGPTKAPKAHAPRPGPRAQRPALAAEPTASTTDVAAQGTMADFGRTPPMPLMETVPEGPRQEVPGAAGFVPTRPSPAPPVPLGRSMSQLTLLLEREKEKDRQGGGA